MLKKYQSPTEPVRHEQYFQFGKTTEVWWTCPKCLSVLVEMKCLHCTRHDPNPEEVQRMSEQMDVLVKEYNALTGKSIAKFASLAIGEKRLADARYKKENPQIKKKVVNEAAGKAIASSWDNPKVAKERGQRHSATVTGHGTFQSVSAAFKKLGIKCKSLTKFRAQLKQAGTKDYEHEGKTYHFSVEIKGKPKS